LVVKTHATLAEGEENLAHYKERRMNIYVGNLSYEVTDEDLKAAFSPFGEVTSAKSIMDRETGRPRGFGFVEMPKSEEAQAAIRAVNGKEIKGRSVTVNEARPKSADSRGGGGGGSSRRW